MFNPEFQDNTYGKGMLTMMASFAAGRKGVSRSEAEAWFAEFETLGAQGKFFFSLNRYYWPRSSGKYDFPWELGVVLKKSFLPAQVCSCRLNGSLDVGGARDQRMFAR